MSQANVETLRNLYEEFKRGNFGAVNECWDPAVEWRWTSDWMGLTGKRSFCGAQEVGAAMAEWLAMWEWFWNEAEDFIDAGDRVVVCVHQHGLMKGSPFELENKQAEVYTFRDEKIVLIENYADRGEALKAVGIRE
jgi:ketosteroid isomerase-like protein